MRSSSPTEKLIWVIRAGKNASAHGLFIEKSLIVLGDAGLGDLKELPKERRAFYTLYESKHPDEGFVAVHGIGGKFFRFVHEIRLGDLVLYPCLLDKRVYFGVVTGRYLYDQALDQDYPHRRKVRWDGSFARVSLSQSARREMGAARTLFQFKSHVTEIEKLISKVAKR